MDLHAYEPLWGTWYLVRPIGAGSCGTVYEACQKVLGHTYSCAVKHISIPKDDSELHAMQEELMTEDEDTLNGVYEQEARAIVDQYDVQKRFSGKEHFVLIHDILTLPKKDMSGYDIFMRMELLSSIQVRLKDCTSREEEALHLGADICSALSEMHRMHYVHRDVKPQNILVSDDGVYKLADFGTVREIHGSASFMSIKGTMDYITPEMMRGQEIGFTSDLYALGLVLYRIMNQWRLPFVETAGASAEEKAAAHARRLSGEALPRPSEASDALADIILRACAYSPADRWGSADEMRRALEKVLRGKSGASVSEEAGDTETADAQAEEKGGAQAAERKKEDIPSEDRDEHINEAGTPEKQQDAGSGEVRRILEQMEMWGKRSGEPIAKASLTRLRNRLLRMDPQTREVTDALARCDELIRVHETTSKSGKAGQSLHSGDRPGQTRAAADMPVPKGISSSGFWCTLVFSFFIFCAVAAAGFGPLPVSLIGAVVFIFCAVYCEVKIISGIGRKLRIRRVSPEQIECRWDPKPGTQYGLVCDGKWVSTHADPPRLFEYPSGKKGTVALVRMGNRPRILIRVKIAV